MLVHFVDRSFGPLLEQACEKNKKSFVDITAHISPPRPTLLMQYKRDLQKLQMSGMDAFIRKYRWVGLHGFRGKPLTRQHVLIDKKKFKNVQTHRLQARRLPLSLVKLCKIGSELSFQRSYIVEVITKAGLAYWPQLRDLAHKHKVSFQDIISCTHEELFSVLSGGALPRNLKERQPFFGLLFINRKWQVVIGKELRELLRQFQRRVVTRHNKSVQGQVAYPGKVTGTVKLAFEAKDAQSITKGQILVSPVTTPDYIMAMRKAAAFVTNEGGVTTHAAIVAREMHKPCIIGTKIATQVLKDGDRVEVDANTGIVKKLGM